MPVNLAAIRCLPTTTLGDKSLAITASIPSAAYPRRPEILRGSEVGWLLDATESPKYRAIFMLAYGARLRVSETTALRACLLLGRRVVQQ